MLTNADLDHLLGLFLLREGERLEVYSTKETWAIATIALGMAEVLRAFCEVTWREPSITFSPLPGEATPLLFRSIPLPGNAPPYAKGHAAGGGHSVAYQFLDQSTGGRLLVAPDVAAPNRELLEAMADSDAILFDGTFWSAEELGQVKPGARTAQQMGHVTIRDGSLDLLRKTAARHKIYTHINNTNPILSPGKAQRAAVEAAGIQVGCDGLQFDV